MLIATSTPNDHDIRSIVTCVGRESEMDDGYMAYEDEQPDSE
jgi:hypothetical protein